MSRYTGWRRLSGDASARPDLLELGKDLLGYLEQQRALSGVKTMSIQRETPDGSVVRARFIGDIPSIEVMAALGQEGGIRRAIALRMVGYMVSPLPQRRYIRALIDIDYFDAQTGAYVAPARKVLKWIDNGSGVPRTEFAFAAPWHQPSLTAAPPEYLGVILSNNFALYDPKLEAIGAITNPLWASTYGEAISNGSETYEVPVPCVATNKIITLGVARDATAFFNTLEPLIFSIDVDTRLATTGRKVADLLGYEGPVIDMQPSPTAGYVVMTYKTSSGGVSTIHAVKVSDALLSLDALDLPGHTNPTMAFSRDGTRLYLSGRADSGTKHALFVIDPEDMTLLDSVEFDHAPSWLNLVPRMFLGDSTVSIVTIDEAGPCIEEYRQADMTLVRRYAIAALQPALTGMAAMAYWVISPDPRRLYLFPVKGTVVVLNTQTGAALEVVTPAGLKQDTGFPVALFSSHDSFYTNTETSLTRNFFLAR